MTTTDQQTSIWLYHSGYSLKSCKRVKLETSQQDLFSVTEPDQEIEQRELF